MNWVSVWQPATEPERLVVIALLDANGIPTFGQGQHFESLYPGLPLGSAAHDQRIMVPEACVDEARALLTAFRNAPSDDERKD